MQAIIQMIKEDAEAHGSERYAQIKTAVDQEIAAEKAMHRDEFRKLHESLKQQNDYEFARRLEYQRNRLNRELLLYQHELTAEIFDLTVSKLREAVVGKFPAFLAAATRGLEGDYILQLGALSEGAIDEQAIRDVAGANTGLAIRLSADAIPDKSGFILTNELVEYSYLFEDVVEDKKNALTAEIMNEVFGDSGDWMFVGHERQADPE